MSAPDGCEVHPITKDEIRASEAAAVRIAIATERARIVAAVTALDPKFAGGYGAAISDALDAIVRGDPS